MSTPASQATSDKEIEMAADGFLVRISKASSPSGVAFIGPDVGDGFKTESAEAAYRFDSEYEANRFADHFRGMWHGFAGSVVIDVLSSSEAA